jgi:hypothetical protein
MVTDNRESAKCREARHRGIFFVTWERFEPMVAASEVGTSQPFVARSSNSDSNNGAAAASAAASASPTSVTTDGNSVAGPILIVDDEGAEDEDDAAATSSKKYLTSSNGADSGAFTVFKESAVPVPLAPPAAPAAPAEAAEEEDAENRHPASASAAPHHGSDRNCYTLALINPIYIYMGVY